MTTAMIFSTVLLTGIGCGVGCGSISTPFLLTRMVGEQRRSRECVSVSFLFLLGKLCMLGLLGALSAWLGNAVLTKVQDVYPNITKWIFRALLVGTGVLILLRLTRKPSYRHCIVSKTDRIGKMLAVSYPLAGAVYAAVPCAPLLLALGYAATMAPGPAILLMVGFGIANSLVPMLLYAPLTGVVIKKLQEEAPGLIKYIQYAAVAALLVLAIVL